VKFYIGSYFDFVAKETAIEFHCKQKDDAALKEAKKVKKDLLESKKVIPALQRQVLTYLN
jgi:penicillin-binding protein-related factor A (putative recombinase)